MDDEKLNESPEQAGDCGDEKCKYLVINGTRYQTTLTKKYEMRKKWVKPDPKQVISYLPGTVLKILVKKGQKINQGEPILILEAMKMQNIIRMPLTGKIKTIHIELGARIPKGTIMIELV